MSSPFLELAERIDRYVDLGGRSECYVCLALADGGEIEANVLCNFFAEWFDVSGTRAFMCYDEKGRFRNDTSGNNEHRIWALLLAHELWLDFGRESK